MSAEAPTFAIEARALAWVLLTPRRLWPRWVILWWRGKQAQP